MRTSTWIGIGVVILLIIAGVWYYNSSSMAGMNTQTQTTDTTGDQTDTTAGDQGTSTAATGTGADVSATVGATTGTSPVTASVTYNGTSFSPSTVTIAKGGSVTFISTAGAMWVASDPHPEHSGYDGTTRTQHCAPGYAGAAPFDQCSPGTSFRFTFNQVGTWGYHNHLNDDVKGTVIVQ